MNKKVIVVLVVVLILVVGGVFYWQYNQKDVRELNKNLPKGVRVVKSLFGQDYKVVNKIDGYEFKVPGEWKGMKELHFFTDLEQNIKGIILESPQEIFIRIAQYRLNEPNMGLELFIEELNKRLEDVYSKRQKEKLGNYEVIKAEETDGAIAISYFFKDRTTVYELRALKSFEDFIREIISNGKWQGATPI